MNISASSVLRMFRKIGIPVQVWSCVREVPLLWVMVGSGFDREFSAAQNSFTKLCPQNRNMSDFEAATNCYMFEIFLFLRGFLATQVKESGEAPAAEEAGAPEAHEGLYCVDLRRSIAYIPPVAAAKSSF